MGLNNKIENNALVIAITSVMMLFFLSLVATVAFFVNLKNEDQVLVPSVEGSLLEDALIELQAKELYPRLQLRFSDDADEKGRVMSQKPSAGSLVKAGRRISLVVSRGTIINSVDNYVGKNINDVKQLFASIFTSNSKRLLIIKEPYSMIVDESPQGTIIAQNPPAGTEISSTTEIEFVVSKGNEPDLIDVPNFVGMDLKTLYATMVSTPIIFSFVKGTRQDIDSPIVASQSISEGNSVATYSKIELTINEPISRNDIFGIYDIELPRYPDRVDVYCDVVKPDNTSESLATVQHYGGNFQLPYYLPEGSVLTITVQNETVKSFDVIRKDTSEF